MSVYSLRKPPDWIEPTPIRTAVEEVEAEGISASMICRRLGWMRRDRVEVGDVTRLRRRIGQKPLSPGSHGGRKYTHMVRYDIAVAIIRAIDRDPVDFDL